MSPGPGVACVYAAGKEWSLDSDYGSAAADTASAYLAMLSIDCLLNVVAALEKLTDVAIEGGMLPPDAAPAAAGAPPAPYRCCCGVHCVISVINGRTAM